MSIKRGVIRGKGTQIGYVSIGINLLKIDAKRTPCLVAYTPVVRLFLAATFVRYAWSNKRYRIKEILLYCEF